MKVELPQRIWNVLRVVNPYSPDCVPLSHAHRVLKISREELRQRWREFRRYYPEQYQRFRETRRRVWKQKSTPQKKTLLITDMDKISPDKVKERW